jgi:flagellar protein FlbD
MIHLTRLNNRPLVVNADLIKFIENAPDTVITLVTGDKLVVRESVQEVLDLVQEFHVHSYRRIAPGVPTDSTALQANPAAPENPPNPGSADKEKS